MNNIEKYFLEAYYKACNTSDSNDWFQTALIAKQMYNELLQSDKAEEGQIQKDAEEKYSKFVV